MNQKLFRTKPVNFSKIDTTTQIWVTISRKRPHIHTKSKGSSKKYLNNMFVCTHTWTQITRTHIWSIQNGSNGILSQKHYKYSNQIGSCVQMSTQTETTNTLIQCHHNQTHPMEYNQDDYSKSSLDPWSTNTYISRKYKKYLPEIQYYMWMPTHIDVNVKHQLIFWVKMDQINITKYIHTHTYLNPQSWIKMNRCSHTHKIRCT